MRVEVSMKLSTVTWVSWVVLWMIVAMVFISSCNSTETAANAMTSLALVAMSVLASIID